MLVVVLLRGGETVSVGPVIGEELAALGITSVTVLCDDGTTAVALEGWAFDAERSADAAVAVLAVDGASARILRPVVESALHPARPAAERAATP